MDTGFSAQALADAVRIGKGVASRSGGRVITNKLMIELLRRKMAECGLPITEASDVEVASAAIAFRAVVGRVA